MSNGSARPPGQLIQLRRDLEYSSQQQQGKSYLVVKDPLTNRYFRFTESQASILDLLKDSPVDAETVAAHATERLGGAISARTIEAFIDSLESKYLIDTPTVRDKLATIKNQKLEDRNLLYWKLASINPERIFAWLLPRTRWAFTPAFHVFAVSTILTGLTISYLNWSRLAASAPSLLTVSGLLLIWPVVFTVVTIHEFSHGLTCCHFGGKVHEVGFMLIYFQPAFFCDVSDSWMFPSRRNRMFVTLAGGYVQLVVWGLCTVVWRITDTDTFINHVAVVVIVFSGLQTLLNFNPLIKLDGYYMLSDYLEIPNLRAKALNGLWERVAGKKPVRPFREERAQVMYGIASVVFSTTLLVYVYSALYTWATSRYAFAGLVGFAMFSTYTLRKTAAESFSGIRALASRAALKKFRNFGIAAAAVFVMVAGHWDLKVNADFRILANSEIAVRAETAGLIEQVKVKEGSVVRKGDVLARLRDFDKQQKASQIEGELKEKRSALAQLRAGARPEEIEQRVLQVKTKETQVANAGKIEEQKKSLEQKLEQRKAQLKSDEQTLSRSQKLFADGGLISKAQLDKDENTVEVRKREIAETEEEIKALLEKSDRESELGKRELAQAESDLRLIRAGNRKEQIEQLEAQVSTLEGQLQLLKEELKRAVITAPSDGVVTTPFVEHKVNEYLDSGEEFCRIVDAKHVTAEMQVPEKEYADIQRGNPVSLRLYSFPTRDFEGRVDFIAPVAQSNDSTTQMIVVRTNLPNDDDLIKPEMRGVAKIYCGDRRIIDLVTRRLRRWVRTEFWDLLP
jgi:multidrug resistance efflux pump